MDLNFKLDTKIKQVQQLKLTTAMVQAIELLAMTREDLITFIKTEAEENPLLEIQGLEDEYHRSLNEMSSREEVLHWQQYAESFGDYSYRQHYVVAKEKENHLERYVSDTLSLYDHLREQLVDLDCQHLQLNILEYIIGCIDEDGYFRGDIGHIAKEWKITEEEVRQHLTAIQSLEPAGIGATDLCECLLLQIERKESKDWLAEAIIKEHLLDLSENKLPSIAKHYKVTGQEVSKSCDTIRRLNPRPACNFNVKGERQVYIWPEAKVILRDNNWEVEFLSPLEQHLSINSHYTSYLESDDKELVEYVKSKLTRANWLFQALESRRKNMEKVYDLVVARQQDFLNKGLYYLKPMTMKQIAEEAGIHESTVSRIVSNKYLETPHGIISMKRLFTTEVGGEESSAAIKLKLRDRIASEDETKPYSDRELVEWFERDGVNIARRTVAKYREELGIPSSRLRKKHFK